MPDHSERTRRARLVRPMLGTVALAMVGCTLPDAFRSNADLVEEGRANYERACASCHGVDARGGGPVTPALRVLPPDLTTLTARHGGEFPRSHVIDVIVGRRNVAAHGTEEMPVWCERFGASAAGGVASTYALRRVEGLADYLATLQRSP